MVARAVVLAGPRQVGIGTDLCQDQPDSIVEWMRSGRWTKAVDYGEGSADAAGFPPMPGWFHDNRDFGAIRDGLQASGLAPASIDGVMGANWHGFFDISFGPQQADQDATLRAAR